MTLLVTEGFETVRNTADVAGLGLGWTPSNGSVTTTACTGSYALAGTGGVTALRNDLGAGAHATVIAGHARNQRSHTTDAVRFFSDAVATEHVVVRLTGVDGNIAIDRGSTQVAITTDGPLGAFTNLDWYYMEVKCTLDDAAGYVEVRINNEVVLTYSGDTKNGGTETVISSVEYRMANDNSARIDDLYLANGAGSAPFNDFLGQVRCYPLAPTADGNSSQLVGSDGNSVSNYQLVDEALFSSSAADYVGSATDDQQDTYTMGDLPVADGTVLGVRLAIAALKSDAGAKSCAPVVRSGGTDYAGSDQPLGTSLGLYRHEYAVDPATGVAWTVSGVNGMQAGFRVRP